MAELLTARELIERRTLGWGLRVEPLGGADYTRVDIALAAGETPLVAGRAALIQDLRLAFCTGRGTDPLNLAFGFDGARLIAEEEDRALLRERLRAAAAIVVDADPRVSRVVDVQVGADPALAARPDATAGDLVRERWITVTFDTLTGERVSVDLGSLDENG
ncbi:hypothetical protein ACFODL_05050 [Phenylobacterium terrae]|uniref:IraD/Gp25-like domain-containing protein n=1 Tax=Phenylobacterium terrae TaxID=2665495 RepID=A0ABW4MZK2_9CAUL